MIEKTDAQFIEDGVAQHRRFSRASQEAREAAWRNAGVKPPWERHQQGDVRIEQQHRLMRLLLAAKR